MSKKSKLLIDEHVSAWLAGYPNPRTRDGYERTLREWAKWLRRQHIPYLEVTRDHVAAYLDELEIAGRAPGTRSGVLSTLSSFYNHLVEEDVLGKNPTRRVPRPVVPSESSRVAPTLPEVQRMLELAAIGPDPREHLLVCLLALNEALSLTLGALRQIEGRTAFQLIGKGGKPALVRLPEQTVAVLHRVRALGDDTDLMARVFPWSRDQACRLIVDLGKRADVTVRVTPHGLRHAHATIAIESGAPMHQVQASMRHSNSATTWRYFRGKEAAQAQVADGLAGLAGA